MTEVKDRIEMVLREVFGGDIDKMAASLDLDRGTVAHHQFTDTPTLTATSLF